MTLAKNGAIQLSDYNNLVGGNYNNAAASSAAATQKAGHLWGVGYGDRGYGQTNLALNLLSATTVTAAQWSLLKSVVQAIGNQQGQALTLPITPTTNSVINASMNAGNTASLYSDALALLDSNRLVASGSGLTLIPNIATTTRGSAWGAGNTGISCQFEVTFADENSARYFFNTGGSINIGLSHPNTSTTQNLNWNTILTAIGTVSFKAATTVRGGTLGTPANIGYYNLSTVNQTILDGTNIGTGAYSANDVTIQVVSGTGGITGSNGAKGFAIKFIITLDDSHTNAFSDTVALGTLVSMGVTKATSFVTGIQTPSISVVVPF